MKILQYALGLPPYRRGGLTRYSVDLSETLSKNNKVTFLYPGKMPFLPSSRLHFYEKKTKYHFRVIEMENPLPVSLGIGIDSSAPYMEKRNKENIVSLLKNENPDVIHIHTLMGLPIEFLEVAKKLNIKVVYTTHDFYGLCPKMLKKDALQELKNRKCTYDCMLCPNGPSLYKIKIMQSPIYATLKEKNFVKKMRKSQKQRVIDTVKMEVSEQEAQNRYRLRMYYIQMFKLIDVFHYNSSTSKSYFRHFLPHSTGKVINITHSGIHDNRNLDLIIKNSRIKFGYIGPYDEKKGFFELCKIMTQIRKEYKNFEVHFYGDILEEKIFKKEWATNHGVVDSSQMKNVYKNIDILIMPSKWHETFGFSVLEALSYGDICIVSKNVGAKDLLPSEFVFKDNNELIAKLTKILNKPLIINEYLKEVEKLNNLPFDFSSHVSSIINEIYKY